MRDGARAYAVWVGLAAALCGAVGGCGTDSDGLVVSGAGTGAAGIGAAGVQAQAGTGAAGIGAAGVQGQAGTGAAGTGAAGTSVDADAGMDASLAEPDAGAANVESGRMIGITAAHNAVRARVTNPAPSPALPALTWSPEIAAIAQAYADTLAANASACDGNLVHSGRDGYGENLSWYSGGQATAVDVVEGWASEVDCWTYGTINGTEQCDAVCAMAHYSSGCGHYTQVVWRDTTQVGCGVAVCPGSPHREIWACNYQEPGNVETYAPY